MAPDPAPSPTLSIANASTNEDSFVVFNIVFCNAVSSAVTFRPTLIKY